MTWTVKDALQHARDNATKQPIGNPPVRRVDGCYVSQWHAHPFHDEASERWAKLAARTTLPPLDARFSFVIDAGRLYIVGPHGRTIVPDDLPPRLTAATIHTVQKLATEAEKKTPHD